jgi:hypothetical protein
VCVPRVVCNCVLCEFPRFVCSVLIFWPPLHVVNCEWLCHLLPPVFFWLQVFMCVCAQVGCSGVYNWSLCDLSVDVCVLICSGFIFCL